MSDRTSSPVTAILAPVPAEVLASLAERDRYFTDDEVIAGAGAYSALASHEPGPSHDDDGPEVRAALALSREVTAPVYVVSFDWDDPRITRCRAGTVEEDDDENPRDLVCELGLGAMLPRPPRSARNFMLIENATPADVAHVLKASPSRDALHLEARGTSVLGWIDGRALGQIPGIVSGQLRTRVLHAIEMRDSFAVLVADNGNDVGTLETPRTPYSEGDSVIESILGETTRDGILRAMGVDDSMNR